MIGRLTGTLIQKQPPFLLLDVSGVGYEVQCSMTTFYKLPEVNQTITLHIHHVVREDGQYLFGFYQLTERALFRDLLKVNGVGPKVALAILSGIDPDGFVRSVMDNDVTRLQKVPGIGKKTASRLVMEMRDRLADWQPTTLSGNVDGIQGNAGLGENAIQEAISALIALGYKPQESTRVIRSIEQPDMSCEALIRTALKGIAA